MSYIQNARGPVLECRKLKTFMGRQRKHCPLNILDYISMTFIHLFISRGFGSITCPIPLKNTCHL